MEDENQLGAKQKAVLKRLEMAHRYRAGRRWGPVVTHIELMDEVGPRYGARIFDLRAEGFIIATTKRTDKTPRFGYRLDAYPAEWRGECVVGVGPQVPF